MESCTCNKGQSIMHTDLNCPFIGSNKQSKFTINLSILVEADNKFDATQSIKDLLDEMDTKEFDDHGIIDWSVDLATEAK